jgi:hypothetical protein
MGRGPLAACLPPCNACPAPLSVRRFNRLCNLRRPERRCRSVRFSSER